MFVCYPQRIIYSPADGAEECSRAALFRREQHLVVNVVLGFVSDYQRDLREALGVLLCRLIEYSCAFILSQIAQRTQRNAASCIISQRI